MSISANFPNVRPSLLLDFANSQQLDPRVTFSRSTTAPYYDGKTSVLAEQNLWLYSNTFTNAFWQLFNIGTPLQNVTAPDGTANNAWTLTCNTTAGPHALTQTAYQPILANTVYTLSCYLQAGNTYNFAGLTFINGSNYITVAFTLTGAGTAGTPSVSGTITSSSTPTITQVGSTAWYRCTIQFSSSVTVTNGSPYFQLFNTATPTLNANGFQVWTPAGTETLLIYGNQLEQRTTATAYNATTTASITNYIPQLLTAPINQPRFDFNPTTGESLGLLIEQSSTNLLTYSQDFSNGIWAKANSTITPTANIAPDGTQTAQVLVESTSNSSHGFYVISGFNQTNAQSYTQTIYAKAKERTWIAMQPTPINPVTLAYFNLGTGVVGTATNCTSTITPVGNGWYRCTVTYTATLTTTTLIGGVYLATGDGGASFTGNGYNGVYVWQNQFENLAFATSPIATTSAQVTRASDNASMTGTNFSSWYNASQGAFYAEANAYANTNAYLLSLFPASGNSYLAIALSKTYQQFASNSGSSTDVNITPALTLSGFTKTGFSIQTNNAIAAINGSIAGTDTSCSFPPSNTLITLYIGSYNAGFIASTWIKKISYYPQVVTSAQLQALTGS